MIGDRYAIIWKRGLRHAVWVVCADVRAWDEAEMCVHVSKDVRRGVYKCGR
jgi:hypothetical protein